MIVTCNKIQCQEKAFHHKKQELPMVRSVQPKGVILACVKIIMATSNTAKTGPDWLDLTYEMTDPHNPCEVDANELLSTLCWWCSIGGTRVLKPESYGAEAMYVTVFSKGFSTFRVGSVWTSVLVDVEAPARNEIIQFFQNFTYFLRMRTWFGLSKSKWQRKHW